eukprot:9167939-Pyramimonas_sp.AAC.1
MDVPHVVTNMGGATIGVCRRNRKLVSAFLSSAEQLLADCGTIQMTLVRGQGGTPADGEEQRAWENSWQVSRITPCGPPRVLCNTP